MCSKLIIIGAGPMAVEYYKVAHALKLDIEVIGRGLNSAKNFEEETGVKVNVGGLQEWLKDNDVDSNTYVIVAVSEFRLGEVARECIMSGFKRILLEKPGGIDQNDIISVANCAKENSASVVLGYNRRFYSSVIEAKKIIEQDGGVTSFSFEFTEWAHVIETLEKEGTAKENWFLQNSSHVIDLAFYLGGKPVELASFIDGSLEWHPAASSFSGAGMSNSGALFNYSANWSSPGRWAIEVLTKDHRLYFKPMEQLQIQNLGSVAVEGVDLDYSLDEQFKPGLYKEVQAFIENDYEKFENIDQQVENLEFYNKILNGK